MDKPTYAELEAEVARLQKERDLLEMRVIHLTADNKRWQEVSNEARRWARQKRQEAEQWKRWYLEVKANVMGKKDGREHPDWLPSDDPDWIPF